MFSREETTQLPRPAVTDDDPNLTAPDAVLIREAVPPPAIMPSVHCNIGFISVMNETDRSVPEINDKGTATVSRALSR